MLTFCQEIRTCRIERKLPLRIIAAELDVDQAILSKIERGLKRATREQVMKLAAIFSINSNDLLLAWLSDNLVYALQSEEFALEALQVAEEKVAYARKEKVNSTTLIQRIQDFFSNDGRVSKVWLFGSYARGQERIGSDVDLMVSYSEKASGTLFDYADIKYQLEMLLNLKIDLVEEGFINTFALNNVNRDKVLIYG
jgi:predicted nucleotidyltransferase